MASTAKKIAQGFVDKDVVAKLAAMVKFNQNPFEVLEILQKAVKLLERKIADLLQVNRGTNLNKIEDRKSATKILKGVTQHSAPYNIIKGHIRETLLPQAKFDELLKWASNVRFDRELFGWVNGYMLEYLPVELKKLSERGGEAPEEYDDRKSIRHRLINLYEHKTAKNHHASTLVLEHIKEQIRACVEREEWAWLHGWYQSAEAREICEYAFVQIREKAGQAPASEEGMEILWSQMQGFSGCLEFIKIYSKRMGEIGGKIVPQIENVSKLLKWRQSLYFDTLYEKAEELYAIFDERLVTLLARENNFGKLMTYFKSWPHNQPLVNRLNKVISDFTEKTAHSDWLEMVEQRKIPKPLEAATLKKVAELAQ